MGEFMVGMKKGSSFTWMNSWKDWEKAAYLHG